MGSGIVGDRTLHSAEVTLPDGLHVLLQELSAVTGSPSWPVLNLRRPMMD